MTDHTNLIERCKEICDWQDTGLLKGYALRNFAASRPYAKQHSSVSIAQAETLREVADAFIASVDRIAQLESRLEVTENAPDGIACRDMSIEILEKRIKELEAEREEREKQEPLRGAFLNKDGGVTLCQNGKERGSFGFLSMLYAAQPVITQHEPVTTVEDRYNADGKSCHITDDLPAGMPLYAAPPVAAPVRMTDSDVVDLFQAWNTTDGASHADLILSVETFVLRANGFKVEDEQ